MTNTGDRNTGHRNTGNRNTGHRNTGGRNTGNCNTGGRNTGDCNTGGCNTGNRNTGHRNTGHRNTGNRNTGDCNTGGCNTGDRNTGRRNSADHCTGAFNTQPQKMILFDKELDMTVEEFYEDHDLYADIRLTEWIPESHMTDEEKENNPTYKNTGGYLKKRTFKEACRLWWARAKNEEKQKFLDLPGFDPDIFKEITGIDLEDDGVEELTMEQLCQELGRKVKIIK